MYCVVCFDELWNLICGTVITLTGFLYLGSFVRNIRPEGPKCYRCGADKYNCKTN